MSSIQFVTPSKGACKLPICSYVIVTMGGSAVLGLNYLLIAVVEIKPLAKRAQSVRLLRHTSLKSLEAANVHMFPHALDVLDLNVLVREFSLLQSFQDGV